MIERLRPSAVVALCLAVSCSRQPDHEVKVRKDDNAFYLSLNAPELANRCYAPKSTQLNGDLGLPEIVSVNKWKIVRGQKTPIDYLDQLLSGKREKIDSTVEMTVPRFVVSNRPFYLIITVFPCDAPTGAKGWKGDTVDIVASADLPLPYPPGYREPGAGDFNSNDELMRNITPAKDESAQRH